MKKYKILLEIFSSLLVMALIYSAFLKLMNINQFSGWVGYAPILKSSKLFFKYAIPTCELVAAVFLAFPKYRLIGFYTTLMEIGSLIIYITIIKQFKIFIKSPSLGVFGSISWQAEIYILTILIWVIFGMIIIETKIKKDSKNSFRPKIKNLLRNRASVK